MVSSMRYHHSFIPYALCSGISYLLTSTRPPQPYNQTITIWMWYIWIVSFFSYMWWNIYYAQYLHNEPFFLNVPFNQLETRLMKNVLLRDINCKKKNLELLHNLLWHPHIIYEWNVGRIKDLLNFYEQNHSYSDQRRKR
jgi:hypothetical protein